MGKSAFPDAGLLQNARDHTCPEDAGAVLGFSMSTFTMIPPASNTTACVANLRLYLKLLTLSILIRSKILGMKTEDRQVRCFASRL